MTEKNKASSLIEGVLSREEEALFKRVYSANAWVVRVTHVPNELKSHDYLYTDNSILRDENTFKDREYQEVRTESLHHRCYRAKVSLGVESSIWSFAVNLKEGYIYLITDRLRTAILSSAQTDPRAYISTKIELTTLTPGEYAGMKIKVLTALTYLDVDKKFINACLPLKKSSERIPDEEEKPISGKVLIESIFGAETGAKVKK